MSRQPLHGRDGELRRLHAALDACRAGEGVALAIVGEPGSGKTRLLDEVAACAGDDLQVVRAVGAEAESELPWSGLHQIVHPLAAHLSRLEPTHAGALRSATALGPAVPVDQFTIGVAVLGLLATAASDTPLVLLVDDLHWFDRASADVLLFVARRLGGEGVVLLMSARDDDGTVDWRGVPEMRIGRLTVDESRALLASQWGDSLHPTVASRLVEAAAGNPLALSELTAALTDDQRAGLAPIVEPISLGGDLRRVFQPMLDALPDETLGALTVVAADPGAPRRVREAALLLAGCDAGALDPAVDAGVIEPHADGFWFRHPLARSFAYQRAADLTRRRAHEALAEAYAKCGDEERRAHHVGMVAFGEDEEAAEVVDAAARRASERGAASVAAELAVRAAELTPSPARAERLIRAAELSLLAGRLALAESVLDEIQGLDTDARTKARVMQVRGRLALLAGRPGRFVGPLSEAAGTLESEDRHRASAILIDAAAAALLTSQHDVAHSLAGRALELAAGDEALVGGARAALAATEVLLRSEATTSAATEGGRAVLAEERPVKAHIAIGAAAMALMWNEDFEGAERMIAPLIEAARAEHALGALPLPLAIRAAALLRRGEFVLSEAAAREAHRVALEMRAQTAALWSRYLVGHCCSMTGRRAEGEAQTRSVLEEVGHGRINELRYNATFTLGHLLLEDRRPLEAIDLLEPLVEATKGTLFAQNPAAYGAELELVEAYVRVGRVADASDLLDRFEHAAETSTQPWPRGHAARLRGLLTPTHDYDKHFERAAELLLPTPAGHVRVLLNWGSRLREDGRKTEALDRLRGGLRAARRSGMLAWTGHIRDELAELGEETVALDHSAAGELSPDELEVAVAVARGADVAQVASALFLSVPTVERRLASAYERIGVHTTEALRERLLGGNATERAHTGWSVGVIGPLQLVDRGEPVPPPLGQPARLIQLVAALGGSGSTDVLVEELWPDVEPGTGRRRLRTLLHRVQQGCPGLLERRGDDLAFAAGTQLDATEFEAKATGAIAAAEARRPEAIALAGQALRLYRGTAFPEVPYEGWAARPRELLRVRQLALLDLIATDAEARGDASEALRHLDRAIEADPFDEDRYLRAAELCLRHHRRSTAIRYLLRARRVAEELDVPVSARLTELDAALRR